VCATTIRPETFNTGRLACALWHGQNLPCANHIAARQYLTDTKGNQPVEFTNTAMAMLVCTLVVNSTGVPLNVEPAATAFRRSKERVTKRNNHLRCVPSYVGHYLNRKGALGLDGLLYNRSN
jgi:hypothetical protein